ncbi:hypothetical protein M758_12G124400, partial [Ceratodon purpureus]
MPKLESCRPRQPPQCANPAQLGFQSSKTDINTRSLKTWTPKLAQLQIQELETLATQNSLRRTTLRMQVSFRLSQWSPMWQALRVALAIWQPHTRSPWS